MAATMWGADVQALRDCAGVFEGAADELRGSMSSVDAAFQSAPWEGSDSETFASEWTTTQQQLEACAASLVQGASDLRRHADEQEGASTDGGGIGGPGPGPGPGDDGSGSDSDDEGGSWWDDLWGWFTGLGSIFGGIVDWLEAAGKNVAKWAKIGGKFFAWLGGVIGIVDIGQFLWNGITNGEWNWGQLVEGVLGVGVAAAAIVGAIIGSTALVVIGIVGGIGLGLHSLAKLIFGDDYLGKAWDGITDAASWAWDGITDGAEWAWDGITDLGDTVWSGMQDFGNAVADTTSNVVDGVSSFVDETANDIADTAEDVWDTVTSF